MIPSKCRDLERAAFQCVVACGDRGVAIAYVAPSDMHFQYGPPIVIGHLRTPLRRYGRRAGAEAAACQLAVVDCEEDEDEDE